MPRFCTSCGSGLESEWTFCGECGTPVPATSAPSTPTPAPVSFSQPSPTPVAQPPRPARYGGGTSWSTNSSATSAAPPSTLTSFRPSNISGPTNVVRSENSESAPVKTISLQEAQQRFGGNGSSGHRRSLSVGEGAEPNLTYSNVGTRNDFSHTPQAPQWKTNDDTSAYANHPWAKNNSANTQQSTLQSLGGSALAQFQTSGGISGPSSGGTLMSFRPEMPTVQKGSGGTLFTFGSSKSKPVSRPPQPKPKPAPSGQGGDSDAVKLLSWAKKKIDKVQEARSAPPSNTTWNSNQPANTSWSSNQSPNSSANSLPSYQTPSTTGSWGANNQGANTTTSSWGANNQGANTTTSSWGNNNPQPAPAARWNSNQGSTTTSTTSSWGNSNATMSVSPPVSTTASGWGNNANTAPTTTSSSAPRSTPPPAPSSGPPKITAKQEEEYIKNHEGKRQIEDYYERKRAQSFLAKTVDPTQCFCSLQMGLAEIRMKGNKQDFVAFRVDITFDQSSWSIFRRWKQFVSMDNNFSREVGGYQPSLPKIDKNQHGGKHAKFNPQFIELRRTGLQQYLNIISQSRGAIFGARNAGNVFFKFIAPTQLGDLKPKGFIMPFKLQL